MRAIAVTVFPVRVRRWLRAQQRRYRIQWLRVGTVHFGNLQRLSPISGVFALDRGLAVDRYYIEQFLSVHTSDIQGHVLEIGDDAYTRMFGGDRVTKSDVLHVVEGNPKATILADLTCADHIPSDTFDCIIFTQTLQMIYDVRAALRHLYRILRPGGTLLATAHGISRIARREGVDPWGEYWHFTSQSMRRLLQETCPAAEGDIKTHGNVLAAVVSLHGLAAEELSRRELDYTDPDYEVLITLRVVKPKTTYINT